MNMLRRSTVVVAAVVLTLVVLGQVTPVRSPAAAADSALDLSGLPAAMADTVKATLSRANILVHQHAIALMGPAGSTPAPVALSVPMLNANPTSQVGTAPTLGLAWVGGTATYNAQLSGSLPQPLVTTAPSTQTMFAAGANLAPGTYQVQIKDQTGKTTTGTFQVLASAPPLNVAQLDALEGHIPPITMATTRAVFYARLGHQYYLQAYQVLLPYSTSSAVANIISALAAGLPLQ